MSSDNLKAMLSGDDFKGIGVDSIERLFRTFSPKQIVNAIEQKNNEKLLKVFTPKKLSKLYLGWRSAKGKQRLVSWLDHHQIDTSHGKVIWNIWQDDAIVKLESNPYRLLAFTNWKTADSIAAKLNVSTLNPVRLVAVVEQCIYIELEQSGSTVMTKVELQQKVHKFLAQHRGGKLLKGDILQSSAIEAMSLASDTGAIVEDTNYIQLPGVYCCEVAIEKFLTNHIQDSSTTQSLVNPSMSRSLNLTEEQDKAVFNAINNKVSLFHGGAGVGKTHTVNAICLASIELGFKPLLLALSAKAVRKLEVTARGFETSTIAKAVLTGPSSFYQKRMLVIDEASMVDMLAFRNLIRNISSDSHIVLCGDFAQLPPIGFGNIFYSFIMKSNLPCQRLSVEKRQQENSGIPNFLSDLRNGVLNPMQRYEFGNSDQKGIFEMNVSNQSIMAKLITLTTSLEGSYQVVSPLNGGKYGTAYLNEEFQLHKFGTLQPVVGTPLIFLKNTRLKSGDYVYNSQIATVSRVFVSSPHSLRSKYLELELEDNIRITITVSEFKELVDFAHVITVHKAQGSDWDTVICVFSRSQFIERAMVYTAISRCKTKCVCVFEDKAYTAQAIASKPSYQTRKDGLFEFKRVSGQPN